MSGESKVVHEQPGKLPPVSLEDKLIQWMSRVLPLSVLKRLPTLYYRINRFRFQLVARPTMAKETSKARGRRLTEGFFDRFFKGRGLDVGYGGDLVVPNCRGWDVEDGDAHDLAAAADGSYDFVYSSHILEHLQDPARALRNWWRVLKPGGYLILYVPERNLFERKRTLPSDVSLDHKHYFLLEHDDPPDTLGLVPLVQRNLDGAQIIYKKICDANYDPAAPVSFSSNAEYSIELVARKPVVTERA